MDLLDDVVALRRALHRMPELSFAETRTSAFLREQFAALGHPVAVHEVAGTGFWFDVGAPPEKREALILLRADMDGLPIHEQTGLPYASENRGCMHACGHDAHMAALAGAARRLVEHAPARIGVRVLFQPAEEGGGGALACMRDGALEGVDMAFGLHVWNELPLGVVALTTGGIMAGVVEFVCEVRGRGGHGAIPHMATDSVVAASHLVVALQTISSRRMPPVEPIVLSVGSIHGGDAFNVIPASVALRGTVRAFNSDSLDRAEEAMREIAQGIGHATGTQIDVTWTRHSRPTVNHARAVDVVQRALQTAMPSAPILSGYRTMAGEDFGEILHRVPGCFVLVGSGNAERGLTEPHHSPRFEIDESVLELGRALHLGLVAVVDHAPELARGGA
jgi:amidohydrolase